VLIERAEQPNPGRLRGWVGPGGLKRQRSLFNRKGKRCQELSLVRVAKGLGPTKRNGAHDGGDHHFFHQISKKFLTRVWQKGAEISILSEIILQGKGAPKQGKTAKTDWGGERDNASHSHSAPQRHGRGRKRMSTHGGARQGGGREQFSAQQGNHMGCAQKNGRARTTWILAIST